MRYRKITRQVGRKVRECRMFARAMQSDAHPILAQVVPTRRCNLDCGYCNEYDKTSDPVPLETMLSRIDRLAALGTTIKIPGLRGEVEIEIPEATQSGQIFRQKGEGLPNPHGGKGDLYVSIRVVVPSKLSREQRRVIEQLGLSMKVENKPEERSSSFFDKVKDIFG